MITLADEVYTLEHVSLYDDSFPEQPDPAPTDTFHWPLLGGLCPL